MSPPFISRFFGGPADTPIPVFAWLYGNMSHGPDPWDVFGIFTYMKTIEINHSCRYDVPKNVPWIRHGAPTFGTS